LGNYLAAVDIDLLKKLNITSVLTIAKNCPLNYGIAMLEHLKLEVEDDEDEDIIRHFE